MIFTLSHNGVFFHRNFPSQKVFNDQKVPRIGSNHSTSLGVFQWFQPNFTSKFTAWAWHFLGVGSFKVHLLGSPDSTGFVIKTCPGPVGAPVGTTAVLGKHQLGGWWNPHVTSPKISKYLKWMMILGAALYSPLNFRPPPYRKRWMFDGDLMTNAGFEQHSYPTSIDNHNHNQHSSNINW